MNVMKNMKRCAVFFAAGGVGYGIIELLWRGHTHWTMILAGGICFVIFSYIAEKFSERPLIFKASLCALGVTLIELIFGLIFNVILKMDVWDYSAQKFNFLGQICLGFSLLWGALGIIFLPLANRINKKLGI